MNFLASKVQIDWQGAAGQHTEGLGLPQPVVVADTRVYDDDYRALLGDMWTLACAGALPVNLLNPGLSSIVKVVFTAAVAKPTRDCLVGLLDQVRHPLEPTEI